MPAPKFTRLSPPSANAGHSNGAWTYTALWEAAGRKVRIRIRVESYEFQSYAVAEVLDPATMHWNQVADIHYSRIASLPGAANAKASPDFGPDEAALIKTVGLLLA
jgi:hypothetical protein